MRKYEGSVSHLASAIEKDLKERKTGLQRSHIAGLSDLSAGVLACRSVNTAEWQAILPREGCDEKSKERYISRLLSNKLISPVSVMAGFYPEVMQSLSRQGEMIILMLDQSKIGNGFECLMLSMRFGERAIPVSWRVVETEGNIGFETQKSLLDQVHSFVPQGVTILLAADRFYGTPSLIALCQSYQWSYRIRLKGNLILRKEGGEITTGEASTMGFTELLDAELGKVTTHVGILHEPGHPEPWLIAMNDKPTRGRILDYGMRWGIESLFSDFKSRGFGITETHLQHPERIERLILVLSIATYWAVSVGLTPITKPPKESLKKTALLNLFF